MAKITIHVDDTIALDGQELNGYDVLSTLRNRQKATIRSSTQEDIVRIDGQEHSITATRIALELLDSTRSILKEWR